MNVLGRWLRAELLHVAVLFAVLAAIAHWLVMRDPVAELAMRGRWVGATERIRGVLWSGAPATKNGDNDRAQPVPQAPAAALQAATRRQVRTARAEAAKPAQPGLPRSGPNPEAGRWLQAGLAHFWRGNYAAALSALDEAARQDTSDCTSWYFMALAHQVAGASPDASRCLAKAVELEAHRSAPKLGRLLQRVQGPHRAWLERARIEARVGPYRSGG